MKPFDLVVIGDGPAGIEGALAAATRHWRVALISGLGIGGRAAMSSLLPSKVWLAYAQRMAQLKHMRHFGLTVKPPSLSMDLLRAQITSQKQHAAQRYRQKLEAAGVQIFEGKGFVSSTEMVEVIREGAVAEQLPTRYILLSTGSGPVFFPELKPNKDRIIAPKLSPTLPELPKRMVVAGGGVTGSEYAWAFAALGTEVTILHGTMRMLPRMDPDVAAAFEQWMQSHYGVALHKNNGVVAMQQEDNLVRALTFSGEEYEADYGFIAIGRKADLSFYEPGNLPLQITSEGFLQVNKFCQTSQPNIYGAGDVTGVPMMANRAMMQARVAVAHMAEGDATTVRQKSVAEAVYTDPPVAQVGDMSPDLDASFVLKRYDGLLKAHILGETEGLLKVKVDSKTGLIRGAAAFGAHAVDIISIFQVAIHHNIPWRRLHMVPMPHPSMSELISTVL